MACTSLTGSYEIGHRESAQSYVHLQKYTIRNMDTGEVYVLDGDDPPAADGMSRSGSQGVTDVMSGNKMTFDELDQALGLQKTIAVCNCLPVLHMSYGRAACMDLALAHDFLISCPTLAGVASNRLCTSVQSQSPAWLGPSSAMLHYAASPPQEELISRPIHLKAAYAAACKAA